MAVSETFDALMAAGVAYYEVEVSGRQITYHGAHASWQETPPPGFGTLRVGPVFSAEGVKDAITRNQKKETTYPESHLGIAQAGCVRYRVDMVDRTVSYLGKVLPSLTPAGQN